MSANPHDPPVQTVKELKTALILACNAWASEVVEAAISTPNMAKVERLHLERDRAIDAFTAAARAEGRAEAQEIDAIRRELKVTDELLAERQRVLDAVPPCPVHGLCVPHAIEWIQQRAGTVQELSHHSATPSASAAPSPNASNGVGSPSQDKEP